MIVDLILIGPSIERPHTAFHSLREQPSEEAIRESIVLEAQRVHESMCQHEDCKRRTQSGVAQGWTCSWHDPNRRKGVANIRFSKKGDRPCPGDWDLRPCANGKNPIQIGRN